MDIKKAEEDIKKASGIEKAIVQAENISLSGADIARIVNEQANIMAYEDLERVTSLDQILKPFGAVIILYQTSGDFGHWVALFETKPGQLEFFDPFGLDVDEELNFDNEFHLRTHQGRIVPHLTHLIDQSEAKVTSNRKQLQEVLEDVNTCGRWVAMRVRFRDLSLRRFVNLFTGTRCFNADFWISAMTLLV